MLKTKKQNTRNPQMKHCLCPKYFLMYRPDFYNLQTGKKQQKKYLRIEIDLSYHPTTKPPISTLSIKLKWSEIRGIICSSDLYKLQTKSEKVQTV